jgi:hypothetical protein
MQVVTYLGNKEFYILLVPTVLWCFDALLGFRIGLLLLTSGSINNLMKIVIGFPRPYWVDKNIKAFDWRPTYGVPSGHSQNALTVWGGIAIWLRKRWLTISAVLLILLISLSRLVLGVHFPTDILGGWLLGAIVLVCFIRFERPIAVRIRRLKPAAQILVALIVSLAFIGLGMAVTALTPDRTIPDAWVQTAFEAQPEGAVDPRNLDELVSASAALFGVAAGGVLLFRWGKFDARGPWKQRALRYLVGVVGLLVFYFGLKLIFPDDESLLDYALRFVRYAAVGFWASYGAPRLFVRLGLA